MRCDSFLIADISHCTFQNQNQNIYLCSVVLCMYIVVPITQVLLTQVKLLKMLFELSRIIYFICGNFLGGDLRCGAIDGPVGSPLQPVFPSLRQRVPKRHCHGSLRWKRPT